MKTYCKNLSINKEHIQKAIEAWKNHESGKKNYYRIIKEYGSENNLINEIFLEIQNKELKFRPIYRYKRLEPTNGKIRIIGIESVKQQICDYLVCTLIEPFYNARVGFYQVAGVKNKGQKLVRNRLKKWILDTNYHVKADIYHCYPSIKHEIVMQILQKYIKSNDILYVSKTILSTYDEGLDIGSYFSLKMSNLVLSFAYHYIEQLYKIDNNKKKKSLIIHQLWYMDDLILFGNNKKDIKLAIIKLERYINKKLGLQFKKWKVAKTSDQEPLDMGGWVVKKFNPLISFQYNKTTLKQNEKHITISLRKGIFIRGKKAFKKFKKKPTLKNARKCLSYWGWFKYANCNSVIRNQQIYSLVFKAKNIVSISNKS